MDKCGGFCPYVSWNDGNSLSVSGTGERLSTHLLENRKTEQVLYIHPSDVPRAGIITPEFELAYVGKGWCEEEFHDHILFDMRKDSSPDDKCIWKTGVC